MDLNEGRLPFKHSLMISKRFSSFWEAYRKAIILFFLIKGPVLLFNSKDLWNDQRYFYSVCAVSLSVLTADIVNLLLFCLGLLLTCCCRESGQMRLMGHLHILTVVLAVY